MYITKRQKNCKNSNPKAWRLPSERRPGLRDRERERERQRDRERERQRERERERERERAVRGQESLLHRPWEKWSVVKR